MAISTTAGAARRRRSRPSALGRVWPGWSGGRPWRASWHGHDRSLLPPATGHHRPCRSHNCRHRSRRGCGLFPAAWCSSSPLPSSILRRRSSPARSHGCHSASAAAQRPRPPGAWSPQRSVAVAATLPSHDRHQPRPRPWPPPDTSPVGCGRRPVAVAADHVGGGGLSTRTPPSTSPVCSPPISLFLIRPSACACACSLSPPPSPPPQRQPSQKGG